MGWKILLPQEIMSEGRKLLEDAGHTVIDGRGFETEDVLADFKEYQPDAMIVRITPITREVIESNPNLKVIVRHGAGFDALVFGDINDPNAFVTKLLDFKDSVRVRPQLGTKPSLRYIPLKKES